MAETGFQLIALIAAISALRWQFASRSDSTCVRKRGRCCGSVIL